MIMIVDDDVGMAETCAMLLEAYGFEVSTASSGAEATTKLNGTSPELLIADSEVPGVSDIHLGGIFNVQSVATTVPVLMISALARREIPTLQSYDGFLRKPFLAENLLIEVDRLLPGVYTRPNNLIGA